MGLVLRFGFWRLGRGAYPMFVVALIFVLPNGRRVPPLEAKSKANAALELHANPVGDAGGHEGTGRDSDDGGVSARTLFAEIPLSRLSHSSSSSHRDGYSSLKSRLDTQPRRLRSACTPVAICVVRAVAHEDQIKSQRSSEGCARCLWETPEVTTAAMAVG